MSGNTKDQRTPAERMRAGGTQTDLKETDLMETGQAGAGQGSVRPAGEQGKEQEKGQDQEKEQQARILRQIAAELELAVSKVRAAVELLDEGNTIPFIARYRKEMTGELDENQLRSVEERLQYLRSLEERKREVIRLIDEQGKLTEELRTAIIRADKLQEVEDLYRPYRQKRKTRASVAKERGLEPLADWLSAQPRTGSPELEAAKYVDPEKEVHTAQDALQGAMDIIAENIADDAKIRAWIRSKTKDKALLVTEAKTAGQESVYEMYYQYQEPVKKLPPHRILAINRGEKEDVLKVRLEMEEGEIHRYLEKQLIRGESAVKALLTAAYEDAYKRLIAPSVEREIRNELTEKAEEQAIRIFSENLRNLLLQPPVKGKMALGVDPAYRTGCKLAVVDETGKMLEVAVTYPTPPHNKIAEAEAVFKRLIEKYRVEIVIIGNGTASRETEQFVADIIRKMKGRSLKYIIVNEAGASVYSASKLAQEEFPELDVAERSAVSIARRLQDPLAELVKIDPKSIGVGQYQHDVHQKRLEESLKAVVESAVNHVGVELNTASSSLLSYVSGINATTAKNIVKFREEKGKFSSREQLLKVPRLGAKTYEQCIGFLRINGGDEPLDNTPIHPESYDIAERLLKELSLTKQQLGTAELKDKLRTVQTEEMAERLQAGVPTLRDIVDSLQRPGRDPREELPAPIFHTDVLKMEDLKPGMQLQGTVRNVIDFGAFVDIGVKQDGLVHISQLSDKYVKHPTEVVSVGDIVTVWVLGVDVNKGRISLTMKGPDEKAR
ncbi:Tex family protein [Ferviditalea candida]|uniref:Tex family protein n=1 Tax=Ferviditalea candida TaxID=3108399 RepID=A0ABU5ZMM7_9BACL|nr:Tex family protein [Paenibacillaceae bacterium T2]